MSCNKYLDWIDLILLSKVSEVCFSQVDDCGAGILGFELSLVDLDVLE